MVLVLRAGAKLCNRLSLMTIGWTIALVAFVDSWDSAAFIGDDAAAIVAVVGGASEPVACVCWAGKNCAIEEVDADDGAGVVVVVVDSGDVVAGFGTMFNSDGAVLSCLGLDSFSRKRTNAWARPSLLYESVIDRIKKPYKLFIVYCLARTTKSTTKYAHKPGPAVVDCPTTRAAFRIAPIQPIGPPLRPLKPTRSVSCPSKSSTDAISFSTCCLSFAFGATT